MFKLLSIATVLSYLTCINPVYAETSPVLTTPDNDITTTDTSPKLSWNYQGNCPTEGSCFLIEVSKTENFSTNEKSTYTNNTSYSPTLSEGIWFWHVKAKNENGVW